MISVRSLKALLIICFLSTFTFCQNTRTDDRVKGWTSDIDFLLAEIRKQHYVYKSQPLPETLIRKAEDLKKAIPQFSDERMILELQRLISLVGDEHSYVLPVARIAFSRRVCRCASICLRTAFSSSTRRRAMSSGSAAALFVSETCRRLMPCRE